MHEGRNQLTIHLTCSVPYCSKYNTCARRNLQKSFASFQFILFFVSAMILVEKHLPRQAQSPQPSTYISEFLLNSLASHKISTVPQTAHHTFFSYYDYSCTVIPWLGISKLQQIPVVLQSLSKCENISILLNICEK